MSSWYFRLFISFKYTGEEIEPLRQTLKKVIDAAEQCGALEYCSLFDEVIQSNPSMSGREIMKRALEQLDRSHVLIAVQTSNDKSEGMLMEVGYALAKKIKIVVATKEGVTDTYLPEIADYAFRWKDLDDLFEKSIEALGKVRP